MPTASTKLGVGVVWVWRGCNGKIEVRFFLAAAVRKKKKLLSFSELVL